jgi:hypothetical protein
MRNMIIGSLVVLNLLFSSEGKAETTGYKKIVQCNGASISIYENILGDLDQLKVLIEDPELKRRVKDAIHPFLVDAALRHGTGVLTNQGDDLRFYSDLKNGYDYFVGATMTYGGAPEYKVERKGKNLILLGDYFSYVFLNCLNISE